MCTVLSFGTKSEEVKSNKSYFYSLISHVSGEKMEGTSGRAQRRKLSTRTGRCAMDFVLAELINIAKLRRGQPR